MWKVCVTLAFSLSMLAAPVRAVADVFQLKGGGEVAGQAQKSEDAGVLVIRTADGAEVTLARNLVARIVQQDEAAAEYSRRSRTMADTADAHRELAKWCREHKLIEEADVHLRRVVELDPNDEEAMRSLDYQRVGNRWLTHEQMMAERGMVMYDGKYRAQQDIAIRERDQRDETVNIDWFGKLRMWRGWLDNRRPERVAEAQALIAAINDPSAAPALARMLADEEDLDVVDLLLGALGPLDHPVTTQTLVDYALDPAIKGDVRDVCLDYLIGNEDRPVPLLPFIQALKSKDNLVVNRAGYALGRIGDAAATSPLIDALVTTHKYQVQPESGGGTSINAGFDPSGRNGGFSMGGGGPQIVSVDKQNQRVLTALMKLSGNQNFEFDEAAWRAWFVDTQMRQHVNSRRDE